LNVDGKEKIKRKNRQKREKKRNVHPHKRWQGPKINPAAKNFFTAAAKQNFYPQVNFKTPNTFIWV